MMHIVHLTSKLYLPPFDMNINTIPPKLNGGRQEKVIYLKLSLIVFVNK